jgi:hypothetical protein
MEAFVLDVSVALSWCFANDPIENTPYSRPILVVRGERLNNITLESLARKHSDGKLSHRWHVAFHHSCCRYGRGAAGREEKRMGRVWKVRSSTHQPLERHATTPRARPDELIDHPLAKLK